MARAKADRVSHRDFLGAHRYTTASDGIVRPAGGVLRTAVACLRQSKGEATLPLRRVGHAYPIAFFAYNEALRSRALPSAKSVKCQCQFCVQVFQYMAGCSYGS